MSYDNSNLRIANYRDVERVRKEMAVLKESLDARINALASAMGKLQDMVANREDVERARKELAVVNASLDARINTLALSLEALQNMEDVTERHAAIRRWALENGATLSKEKPITPQESQRLAESAYQEKRRADIEEGVPVGGASVQVPVKMLKQWRNALRYWDIENDGEFLPKVLSEIQGYLNITRGGGDDGSQQQEKENT